MAGYEYSFGCGQDEAAHVCHDCPGGRVREFGRARRGGFIKESYLATIKANPTDLAAWEYGVANGLITILPETSGEFDPGTPSELPGYGDRRISKGPRTMTLTLNDPDYFDNYHYYNEIANRTSEVPFYVTSSILHLFDKPASIHASDPVEDNLESEVVWQVTCEVVSENLPSKHKVEAIKSIFDCPNF